MLNAKERVASDLYELAKEFQKKSLENLIENRHQHGFQHFIADLKDESFEAEGWSLKKGLLTVHLPLVNPKKIFEIQEFINTKLGKYPWFKLDMPRDFQMSPHSYHIPLKTLGAFGPNKAVDPILFVVEPSGRLNILAIRRFDGVRALPGGMLERNVVQTCLNELLEEVFSGDLFKLGSDSARLIDTKFKTNPLAFKVDVIKLIQAAEPSYSKSFRPHLAKLMDMIEHIDEPIPSVLLNQILRELSKANFPQVDSTELSQIQTHIKCDVYKQCCEEQYSQFKARLEANLAENRQFVYKGCGEFILNVTDPRNTDIAYMVTVPLPMVVDAEFIHSLSALGLGITATSAGDDAIAADIIPLEEFCSGEHMPYSDHATLVLHVLADLVSNSKLVLTDGLKAQVEKIHENFILANMDSMFNLGMD